MTRLIGVTGPSCSGKSTVCRALEDRETQRLKLDDFYREEDELNELNYDHPKALKFEEFLETLKELKKGREVTVPDFDKTNLEITGEKKIKPVERILADGFMLLHHPGVRETLDIAVFLDIPKQEQLKRRMKRFREGDLDTDEEYFHECVYPAYKRYIEPTKKHADHVVDADKEPEEVIETVKKIIK